MQLTVFEVCRNMDPLCCRMRRDKRSVLCEQVSFVGGSESSSAPSYSTSSGHEDCSPPLESILASSGCCLWSCNGLGGALPLRVTVERGTVLAIIVSVQLLTLHELPPYRFMFIRSPILPQAPTSGVMLLLDVAGL
jgi:hypothetical protein